MPEKTETCMFCKETKAPNEMFDDGMCLKCRELELVGLKEMEKEQENLRKTRLEIALSICKKYPSLYKKMRSDKLIILVNDENTALEALKNLIALEPTIENVLKTYFK